MKLEKNKLLICCDGGGASGKTTGAKLIAKKYKLNFLSSGNLYRFASYKILKNRPSNEISYLKKIFKKFKVSQIKTNKNLHSPIISEHTSLIAKKLKIRKILKDIQIKFVKSNRKSVLEGRDTAQILPAADIKFFFKCSLDIASKRRFLELRKKNKKIKFIEVKKSLKLRNLRDKSRKHSPLLKSRDAIVIDTGKLTKKQMVNVMSKVIDRKLKNKYENRRK